MENLVLEIAATVISAGILGVWSYQIKISRRLNEFALGAQRREDAIEALHREKTYILQVSEQTHADLQEETADLQQAFAACRAQCSARSVQYARGEAEIKALCDRIARLEKAVDEIRAILLEIRGQK